MSRDKRLADLTLSMQYAMSGLTMGNPWVNQIVCNVIDNRSRPLPVPPEMLVAILNERSREATTIAVDTEFTETIKTAAEDLAFSIMENDEEPEVLLPYDLPAKTGFVRFAHHISLFGVDFSESEEKYPLMVAPIGFLWWSDSETGVSFIPLSGRFYWKDLMERHAPTKKALSKLGQPPEVLPTDFGGWHFGKKWTIDPDLKVGDSGYTDGEDGETVTHLNVAAASDRLILFSFFRLVSQKIPRSEDVFPSRQMRKRRPQIHQNEDRDGSIRLYTLRKELPEIEHSETHTETEWTHRWVVEPHWTKRRVAVRDSDGNIIGSTRGEYGKDWIYRRVYIDRHVKGPEHLPLKLKDPVGILKR